MNIFDDPVTPEEGTPDETKDEAPQDETKDEAPQDEAPDEAPAVEQHEEAEQAEAPAQAPVARGTPFRKAAAVVAAVVVAASIGAYALARSSKPSTSTTASSQLSGRPQFGGGRFGNGPGGGPGFGMRRGGLGAQLGVVAQTIGISQSDLLSGLQSGQSIADIARAHSVDPQKVIDALVASVKQQLAAAVSSGALTQAQADQLSADMTARIAARVNGTGFGPPPGPGAGAGVPQQPAATPQPTNDGNTSTT